MLPFHGELHRFDNGRSIGRSPGDHRTCESLACFLFVASVILLSAQSVDLTAQERVQKVTSMYTGADGLTHFKEIGIPQDELVRVAGVSFGVHAVEAPHTPRRLANAPSRRYVLTLSGAANILASSGERFIADPSHILLAEDLTGKGHSTQAVGPEPWVRMIVEIDQPRSRTER